MHTWTPALIGPRGERPSSDPEASVAPGDWLVGREWRDRVGAGWWMRLTNRVRVSTPASQPGSEPIAPPPQMVHHDGSLTCTPCDMQIPSWRWVRRGAQQYPSRRHRQRASMQGPPGAVRGAPEPEKCALGSVDPSGTGRGPGRKARGRTTSKRVSRSQYYTKRNPAAAGASSCQQ